MYKYVYACGTIWILYEKEQHGGLELGTKLWMEKVDKEANAHYLFI